jgi:cytochrome c biogenesis protein
MKISKPDDASLPRRSRAPSRHAPRDGRPARCQVLQFYSDLSLFNLDGKEVMRKTIKVNDPLRYGGITIYQTDWGFSALQVKKNGEGPFNLAMAPLKLNGDKKLFGTFLPLEDSDSSNPSVKGMYV